MIYSSETMQGQQVEEKEPQIFRNEKEFGGIMRLKILRTKKEKLLIKNSVI